MLYSANLGFDPCSIRRKNSCIAVAHTLVLVDFVTFDVSRCCPTRVLWLLQAQQHGAARGLWLLQAQQHRAARGLGQLQAHQHWAARGLWQLQAQQESCCWACNCQRTLVRPQESSGSYRAARVFWQLQAQQGDCCWACYCQRALAGPQESFEPQSL